MARTKTLKSTKQATPESSKLFYEEIHKLVSDKGFDRNEVMAVVEAGLLAAYRKKYKISENARVVFDREKEDVYIVSRRTVVDKVVLPGMQIELNEARKIKPDAQIGDEIDIIERVGDYGRSAAHTALQVVSQRLKILEQNKIRQEYSSKIGELMNGYILRKKNDTVYIDLGKAEAIMPLRHQIPGEKYRVEDKIKVLLLSIENEPPVGLKIIVSRADKRFVQKLFEMEVPEIYDKIVEIVAIARAPGIRTKIVVASNRSDVDPVGACVGMRGVRIQAIVRELGNERIDIVAYSRDPAEFIKNAMTPANPVEIKVDSKNKEALVIVPDKELAIAIGKDGTNVKLASQVTGYKLDVKSHSQFSEEMASPEARRRLDELFSKPPKEIPSQEEEGTPLEELPGLTSRIIRILKQNNIRYIEDLVSLQEEELINMEGIGRATAKQIMAILAENVEFEEEEGEEEVQQNKEEKS
ncbi:MAG: transcription termination factor NusA [Leptospiraceae bacterium]|nr:transcription termination factor NusA [Leptospiraceae bacterium]MDW8306505.1 transcription termination factor NusA [Leptospiraceae bacterium]